MILSANVSKLVELCNSQRISNIKLRSALRAQEAACKKLQDKVASLEGELSAVSVSKGMLETNTSARVARARVNNLIKQVDKCIAMLNR